jgi:para-aminobenzoate synthetase component I
MDKSTAIDKMNWLGERKKPFFFAIDFAMKDPFVQEIHEPGNDILFDLEGLTNHRESKKHPLPLRFSRFPEPYREYRRKFDAVMKEIRAGNTYLLNLTSPTRIETNYALEEIYHSSKARFRLLVPGRFVVFSPEVFVRIHDGRIFSFPMKGTIRADIPDAEKIILEDRKELAEHYTIVDLIRNDLSIVAENVSVDNFRYIERIRANTGDLLQVSSSISGKLTPDYHSRLGTILFQLLPAGSVTGAPKEKTVEIIRNTEGYDRGCYTGVFGYFDGSVLNSCVMIRFIEQTDNGLVYKSGGGITSFSDPVSEYNELIDKVYVPVS